MRPSTMPRVSAAAGAWTAKISPASTMTVSNRIRGGAMARFQVFSQHLAERIARHVRAEVDLFWLLETRQALAAELDQFLRRGHSPWLENDQRRNPLAPLFVRQTEHDRFLHRRVQLQHQLHFLWRDVFSTADDHVRLATGQE